VRPGIRGRVPILMRAMQDRFRVGRPTVRSGLGRVALREPEAPSLRSAHHRPKLGDDLEPIHNLLQAVGRLPDFAPDIRVTGPKEAETHLAKEQLNEQRSDDKRRIEVPWSSELRSVQRSIILGQPGGGKTFLTKTTVIEAAREAHKLLDERAAPIDSLTLPIRLYLPDLSDKDMPEDFAKTAIRLLRRNLESQAAMTSSVLEQWIEKKNPRRKLPAGARFTGRSR
jgi:hypothetical protein